MTSLDSLLNNVAEADARAALYYVGRYVKQARNFVSYDKDIFDDERRSAPNNAVKSLARILIDAIEEREGLRAEEFEYDRMLTVIREIAAIERNLGPEISDEEVQRVGEFVTEFNLSPPKI